MGSRRRSSGLDVLADVRSLALNILQDDYGVSAAVAARMAEDITKALHRDWRGLTVYIPKGRGPVRTEELRDAIRSEFDGANQVDLARRYNVSLPWVYQVLREER